MKLETAEKEGGKRNGERGRDREKEKRGRLKRKW